MSVASAQQLQRQLQAVQPTCHLTKLANTNRRVSREGQNDACNNRNVQSHQQSAAVEPIIITFQCLLS
eukprot:1005830-Amphidinium_carterae.1